MGLSSRQHDHARHRDGQGRRHDRGKAPPHLRGRGYRHRFANRLIAILLALGSATAAAADTLRVASYNTELSRKGPGILLRDIRRGEDEQIGAVIDVLAAADADVVALQGIDYDLQGLTVQALSDALRARGLDYPHHFAGPPNAGRITDLDLDGDGTTGEARDAQGYGRFFGQGAMAVLSRYPIDTAAVQDFSDLLWRDLPDALLPGTPDKPFPSADAMAVQRLSSNAHWAVPVLHPTFGTVTLLTFHATPPVFDGPEDRNGRRNHDEVLFWTRYLDGTFGPTPAGRFVLAGDANLDPHRGDGRGVAIRTLLDDPRLQDPLPGAPTVIWDQTGPMRVDYVLPSADWTVTDAGISAPRPEASRHRLVWVDLGR